MSAGTYNLAIEQGATFTRTFVWEDGGTPVNITGYSARMKIKNTIEGTLIISLTSPSSGIVLGTTNGQIVVTITAAQTAAMTVQSGVYDLELVSGSGVVTRLLQGTTALSLEVTDD